MEDQAHSEEASDVQSPSDEGTDEDSSPFSEPVLEEVEKSLDPFGIERKAKDD